MFETTIEAQALDGGGKRFGTLSAAALFHLGIVAAIAAVAALIVPPVVPPELPPTITIILPRAIPMDEASPPPAAPRPQRGTEHAGAPAVVPRPPADPAAPPVATPDKLPEAPPYDGDLMDGDGPPGVADGAEDGVKGGTGDGPPGDGDDPYGSSVLTLTGEMERPVLLTKVEPVYPTTARRARMAGRVTVEAVVGLDGGVESAEVISSTSPLFDASALEAVRHWRYRPARMNGRPVRVYFKVAVEFVLR